MTPPIIEGKKGEQDAVLQAAKFMLAAARTAPKTAGIDDVMTLIVYGEDKDAIARKMEDVGEKRNVEGFKRDAKNVRDSEAVILIGVKGKKA